MGQYYLIGNGSITVSKRDANGNYGAQVGLGNCPAFQVSFSVETLDHFESESGLNNQDLQIRRNKKAELSITLEELTGRNLALLTQGTTHLGTTPQAVVGETIGATLAAGDPYYVKKGGPISAVTVVDNAAATIPAANYTLDANEGILIFDTITAAQPYKVSYTVTGTDSVTMFDATGVEWRIVFKGINKAQSGKRFTVRLHRVQFNPVDTLPMLGEEVAQFTLTGSVLQDDIAKQDPFLGPFGVFYYDAPGTAGPMIEGTIIEEEDEGDGEGGELSVLRDEQGRPLRDERGRIRRGSSEGPPMPPERDNTRISRNP